MASLIINKVTGAYDTLFKMGQTGYPVVTASGDIYVFSDTSWSGDLFYYKSTDGGLTFSEAVSINSASPYSPAIWYDRWSADTGDLIHIAFVDATSDDILYRNLDTTTDTLSAQTTAFLGLTATSTGGSLSITRARGGNLYIKGNIDNGVEGGFFKSTDVGATWSTVADSEALAAGDCCVLLPGWAADTNDIMGIFWDADADELSRILYDDSAGTWSETSISTGMVDAVPGACGMNMAAAVDLANSRNIVIAWNAISTLNADLKCWTVTEAAITAKTDVVLNSVENQGAAALAIDTDTGNWHAFYLGSSDGAETVDGASYATIEANLYTKISTDEGATWGAETQVTNMVATWAAPFASMRFSGQPVVKLFYEEPLGQPFAVLLTYVETGGGAAGSRGGIIGSLIGA